jgi:hypothetical protein
MGEDLTYTPEPTSAAETFDCESPALDISVFNDSVSATIALIAPRLSKEERETRTYMILHSVMDKTRSEQALNEFMWILDFGFPQTTFIVFGRSRNSWK